MKYGSLKLTLVAASALILAACAQATPLPDADTALATEAMRILSSDAMDGRKPGTAGSVAAQAYLAEQVDMLGFGNRFSTHDFSQDVTRRNGTSMRAEGTNLIVEVRGKTADGPVLEITAHYDHLGRVDENTVYNGADDNASGVGALLAVLKSFEEHPPEHDVRIVWFDAEEMGLAGARHYVSELNDNRPRANLNLDMIAQNADGEIYMSGAYHTPALKPLVEQAAKGVDITVIFGHDRPEDGANDWTNQSDHAIFHQAAIPFVYLGVVDHEHYHKTTDEFETIPLPSYHAAVELAVRTAHVLDDNLNAIAIPKTASASTSP